VFERLLPMSRAPMDGHEGLAAATAFLARIDFFHTLLAVKK
jgi:hypothetical protein